MTPVAVVFFPGLPTGLYCIEYSVLFSEMVKAYDNFTPPKRTEVKSDVFSVSVPHR
jgi:hypothetical protein